MNPRRSEGTFSSSPHLDLKSEARVQAACAASRAALNAAIRLWHLGLARCGGKTAPMEAFFAPLARPTARSRSGPLRIERVTASTASATSLPPSTAAHTASCRRLMAPASIIGAAIQRLNSRRPASVAHPHSILASSEPSLVPSEPHRSSRLANVAASIRTRPPAYTSCFAMQAEVTAVKQFKRLRCDLIAAAHALALGCAVLTCVFVAHVRGLGEPAGTSSSIASDWDGSIGNSSPGVSAVTVGLETHLTISRWAHSLTRPRVTSTSAGATCASNVASATRCSSSRSEPIESVPAAASRNAYPTVTDEVSSVGVSLSASRVPSSPRFTPRSSVSSTNARTCTASTGALASMRTSPSVLVAGVATSASCLRITCKEKHDVSTIAHTEIKNKLTAPDPPRAFACAAFSSCSIRPTLYPRCTSRATAASTPASGHPTCLQCPTPLTVIFQSNSAHPISASRSYSS